MAVLAIVSAGVALGIYLWTVFGLVKDKLLLAHMIIGLIIFALLLIQSSAALVLRPKPKSKYRCAPAASVLSQKSTVCNTAAGPAWHLLTRVCITL